MRLILALGALLLASPAMAQQSSFCFGIDTPAPAGATANGRIWILAMPASGVCPAGSLPPPSVALTGATVGTQHLATATTAMVVPAGTMYATVIPHADGSLDVTYFK